MSDTPVAAAPAGHRPRWWRPVVPLIALITTLTLFRVVLLIVYREDFETLSAGQAAGAFLWGLRFDVSIALQLIGVPLALSLVPHPVARSRLWQTVCGWGAFVGLFAGWLLSVADLVYFPDVHRHIGSDLANSWGSDWATLLKSALDFPLALGAFLLVVAMLARGWGKALARPAPGAAPGWRPWARYAAIVALLIVGWRGGLQRERLRPIHAFAGGSAAAGYLALNGPFSALHAIEDRGPVDIPGDLEASLADLRSRFALDDDRWVAGDAPLQRIAAGGSDATARRPNVVILVFESWDAVVTDALRARAGLPPIGATPTFDGLIDRGTLYSRFYSSGQRSLEGLTALLASFPTLPGIPYLGDETAGVEMSFLGTLASDLGYSTHMVRSAARESFNLGSVADLAGFGTYAGAEEVLARPSHSDEPSSKWGAWDFDSLRYLHGILAAEDGPFVALFFGSSTHTPFPSPGEQWRPFGTATETDRFHNAVHYTDWALGRYLALAREAGYFDDTIWIVTSDQGSRMVDAPMSPARFHIPALVFGPGVPAGVVDDQVASHMDVLPTLIDLAGWRVSHSSFGESLLRDREPRALLKAGSLVMRIGDDGWVLHSLRARVGGEGSAATLDRLEDRLLAEARVATGLFHENRIYRRP